MSSLHICPHCTYVLICLWLFLVELTDSPEPDHKTLPISLHWYYTLYLHSSLIHLAKNSEFTLVWQTLIQHFQHRNTCISPQMQFIFVEIGSNLAFLIPWRDDILHFHLSYCAAIPWGNVVPLCCTLCICSVQGSYSMVIPSGGWPRN
jgi:hypothetical protein